MKGIVEYATDPVVSSDVIHNPHSSVFDSNNTLVLDGNMAKVTPVTAFEDRQYQIGPLTRRAREMYWDWALSTPAVHAAA